MESEFFETPDEFYSALDVVLEILETTRFFRLHKAVLVDKHFNVHANHSFRKDALEKVLSAAKEFNEAAEVFLVGEGVPRKVSATKRFVEEYKALCRRTGLHLAQISPDVFVPKPGGKTEGTAVDPISEEEWKHEGP